MDMVQMTLSASVLIVVVAIIRPLTLHKLPKKTFLVLWGVVICRLLLPFSVPFSFSFYTGMDTVKRMFMERSDAAPFAGLPGTTNVEGIPEIGEPVGVGASIATFSWTELVWLTGMCAFALFFVTVYIKCRREFQTSLPVENEFIAQWLREHPLRRPVQIRQSDRIKAPLTYGVFRPVILLPRKTDWTDEEGLKVVLTHEFVHIQHFDALTKLVLTAAVCVHWFNPFVWVMYVLANRDIELSCDEKVVRTFGVTMKSAYAMMLVNMEETKSGLTPLANHFSKNSIEERIVAIMKMKKTTVPGTVLALVLVVGITTAFATTASTESPPFNNKVTPKSIHTTGATIIPAFTDIGTHMDVELIKGGVFVIGRETWEKGDEIVFRIHAEENMELYAGILPAEEMEKGLGYNSYGLFASKKVQAGPDVQHLSFIIPETGEYGIGVQHINNEENSRMDLEPEINLAGLEAQGVPFNIPENDRKNGTVTFELEINKVFENPFIK